MNEARREMAAKIGKRISLIRKASGLSQAQLGDATGIDRHAVGFIETGDRLIHVQQLVSLCTALNVSPEYILGIDTPKGPKFGALTRKEAEKVYEMIQEIAGILKQAIEEVQ